MSLTFSISNDVYARRCCCCYSHFSQTDFSITNTCNNAQCACSKFMCITWNRVISRAVLKFSYSFNSLGQTSKPRIALSLQLRSNSYPPKVPPTCPRSPHSVNTAVCATRLFCNNIRNTLAMTSAKKKRILLRRMQCMFMYGVIAANATISGGFAQRLVNACKYGPNAFRMFTGTAQNIALAAATIKFSSSCNTTRSHLQTKNRAHTAATLKSSSPGRTPDIPPIAPPNTKSCCHCSYTQIILLGGAPDPRGGAANSELRNTNFRHSNFSKILQLAPEICRFLIIHTKTIKINESHTQSLISERTSSHGIPSTSMDFDAFRIAPCSQVIRGMSHDSGFLSNSMDFVTFRYSKRSRGLAGFSHLSRIL